MLGRNAPGSMPPIVDLAHIGEVVVVQVGGRTVEVFDLGKGEFARASQRAYEIQRELGAAYERRYARVDEYLANRFLRHARLSPLEYTL